MKPVNKARLGLTISAVLITAAVAAETQISRSSIDSGGFMRCTNGGVELSGTIGQHDAAILKNGNVTLMGGFWYSLPVADCNSDGLVNLNDYLDWPPCLAGPGTGVSGICNCLDFDQDRDIDLLDAAEFQIRFVNH